MRNFTRTKFTLKAFSLSLFFAAGISDAGAQVTKKTDIPQFSMGRWGAMSFTINNTIYLAGGYAGTSGGWHSDLMGYDAAQDKWTAKADLPGGINATNRAAGVAFTINGKGYMALGARNFLDIQGGQVNYNDIYEYDPTANTWTQKASMPDSGRTDAGVFVINNKAYIVGGERRMSAGGPTNQVWEYDPAADKWTKKADFPATDVQNPAAFAIDGKGYIMGGSSGGSISQKTYMYDPVANTWTPKASFTESERQGGVAFVHGNTGYVLMGGKIGGPYTKTLYKYVPSGDYWAFVSDKWTAQPRLYGVAQILGDKVYTGCGWRLDGSAQTFFKDWYEIDMTKVLGIDDAQASDNKLALYPNPATNIVYVNIPGRVQGEGYQCSILNMTGQEVHKAVVGKDNRVETGHLPAGQYILTVNNGKDNYRAILSLRGNQ